MIGSKRLELYIFTFIITEENIKFKYYHSHIDPKDLNLTNYKS